MSSSILIGICTSSDESTIGQLLKQCFSIMKKYEENNSDIYLKQIIVISSGSTDNTNNIIGEYKRKYPHSRGYNPIIESTRKGKTNAINQILDLNESDFVVFIPADVSITFKSIDMLIKKIYKNNKIAVVSGNPIPNLDLVKSKGMRSVIEAIWVLHDETLKYTTKNKFNSHSSGELMIMRSKVIESIPEHIINEDAYLALKAKSLGYKVEYEARSLVKIEVPQTMNDYLIQRKRILMGHSQLSKDLDYTPSNFKSIAKRNPISTIKIMKNLIKSSRQPKGLLLAIILELRIELELFFIRLSKKPIKKQPPIWRRINQLPIN